MPIRIDGTNATANPGITGDDADTGFVFGTNEIEAVTGGTTRFTVESTGNVTIEDGNLVVASGHGIDFSADPNAAGMTSELLDDYEEGTWTPILTNGTSAPTFTASPANTTAYYVKVGNLCTINYYSGSFTVASNGSGSCRIRGLPFNVANLQEGYATATFTHANCFSSQIQNGYGQFNSDEIVPILQNGTSGTSWITGSAVYLMFSLTYRTDS